MQFDRFRAMEIFVRVVQAGTLTAAAEALGISQPAVTKSVRALEEHLGTRLLNRTSRRMSLTDEGGLFYEDARRLLDGLEAAEARIGQRAMVPTGLLRIACPVAFGRMCVLPVVAHFLDAHPSVSVEAAMSDALVDLIEQGVDVAIRLGALADSSLRAQRIGRSRRIIVAAPRWLEVQGVPEGPEALEGRDAAVYANLTRPERWTLSGPDNSTITVDVRRRLAITSSEGVRVAVRAGLGVAEGPEWMFRDMIKDGSAVHILQDWTMPALDIHAVYPPGRHSGLRTSRFVDALRASFAADPVLSWGDA